MTNWNLRSNFFRILLLLFSNPIKIFWSSVCSLTYYKFLVDQKYHFFPPICFKYSIKNLQDFSTEKISTFFVVKIVSFNVNNNIHLPNKYINLVKKKINSETFYGLWTNLLKMQKKKIKQLMSKIYYCISCFYSLSFLSNKNELELKKSYVRLQKLDKILN